MKTNHQWLLKAKVFENCLRDRLPSKVFGSLFENSWFAGKFTKINLHANFSIILPIKPN